MAFHNQVFPLDLAALKATIRWPANIIKLGGGAEQRVILQSNSRRSYDAMTAIQSITAFNAVIKHFNARRGPGFSYPVRDKTLFKVTTEPFGTGGAIGSTNQLTLNEGDASNAYNREIYLPEVGTIHIFAGVTEKTEGVHWTLAYTGATAGLVTWLTSVSGQTLTWTGSFYIPVRYDAEDLPGAEIIAMLDSATGVGLVEGVTIPLIEVRYPSEWA